MSICLRSVHCGACLAPLTPVSCFGYTLDQLVPSQIKKWSKWRFIVDLSSPEPLSVNDGISKSLCSLAYARVKDAARAIVEKGQGSILAKIDIASAYRVVPIHPDDRWLLGMYWDQKLFVDTQLPLAFVPP